MKLVIALLFALTAVNAFAGSEEELARLKARVERAQNPFEVLNLPPSATQIEIERETSHILERLSGWNIWELTKYTDREEELKDLVKLTEKDQRTLKKVVDSYSLWMNIKSQKGFKIGFGRWKWNLGKPDKVEIEVERYRDITIFFKDQFGEYDVRWGKMDFGSDLIPPQTGYLVKFRSMAADPANQALVDDIKLRMKNTGGGLHQAGELLRLRKELERYINVPSDSMYTQNQSMALVKELDIRYKMDDVLPTYLINRILKHTSKGKHKNCSALMRQLLF